MTKSKYSQIREMLDTIFEAVGYLDKLSEEKYRDAINNWMENFRCIVENVNIFLLDSVKVEFCDLDDLESHSTEYGYRKEVTEQYRLWANRMTEVLERQYYSENNWSCRFVKLMDYIRYVDTDSIVKNTKKFLMDQGSETIQHLCVYYQNFSDFWGTLDVDHNRYDVILNRVAVLKDHQGDFQWLYDQLGDQRSRMVLTGILYNWLTFDLDCLRRIKEANYTDYFDLDLVECDEQEVMVDLGAWTGDSTLNYINTYGKYKRIYCYEIDESSIEKMKKNLGEYPDIEFRNKGVGNVKEVRYMEGSSESTINRIVDYPTEKRIEMVRLDDDIEEKVTLIKMDIEGFEQNALVGCTRHIQEDNPKLLISVYHNNEDIYKIPRMIFEMNPNYNFYLRSNGTQWGPAEIVLLAIPTER